jgi:hypothetical protein
VYAADDRGIINVWDLRNGTPLLNRVWGLGAVYGMAINPSGTEIVSAGAHKILFLWDPIEADPQGGQPLRGHNKTVRALAYSPDGQYLVSGSEDGNVIVWNPGALQANLNLNLHDDEVRGLACSPDSKYFATASKDKTVKVWDIATGNNTESCTGHEGPVYGVAFHPNGNWLASAGHDQTIKLWDRTTRQEVRTFRGHTGPVYSVVFSPDGSWLASGSFDKSVRIWETATGKELACLDKHEKQVWSVAISGDSRWLLSGSEDGTARLWELTINGIIPGGGGGIGMFQPPGASGGDETGQPGTAPGKDATSTIRDRLARTDRFDRTRPGCRYKMYNIKLKADCNYQMDMAAQFDPYLRVEDTAGNELASDDGSGSLFFTPAQSGTYRIIASSLDEGLIGPFTLRVTLQN